MKSIVTWKHTLFLSCLICLIFTGIDWLHLFLFGTKFTYLINYLSPTSTADFIFYELVFAGLSFLVGLLANFDTKDVVVAGIIGPFLFLGINGLIIHFLLVQNPAYASNLILHWQAIYGTAPDWSALLPLNLQTFWMLYAQSLLLFFILAFPLILVCCFSGHVIRVMSGWNRPS